jgi:hypothetical protein
LTAASVLELTNKNNIGEPGMLCDDDSDLLYGIVIASVTGLDLPNNANVSLLVSDNLLLTTQVESMDDADDSKSGDVELKIPPVAEQLCSNKRTRQPNMLYSVNMS